METQKTKPFIMPQMVRRLDNIPKKLERDPLSKARNVERGFQRTIYVMSIITPNWKKRE